MKLLIDEHLPHLLQQEIPGHEVLTVAFMKWSGIENGELLSRAAEGFDALVTNDHGVEHEQNLATLPVSVIFLNCESNTIEALRPLIPALLHVLERLQPRQFIQLT